MKWLLSLVLVLVAVGTLRVVGCGDGGDPGGTRAEAKGVLDPTFAVDGIAVHDGAVAEGSSDYGYDLTIDDAGRIAVSGLGLKSGGHHDMVIWRYNSDGSLDAGFGDDGLVVYQRAYGNSEGYAIVNDAEGKLVVAGSDYDLGSQMMIWRYETDGAPDTSFGDNGVVVYKSGEGDRGHDLAMDSSGRILVTGTSNSDMAIWRYTVEGTLDTSFGNAGVVTHDNAAGGGGYDEGYALTIDAEGRILATGRSVSADKQYSMVIWRYNSDGTLDASFGVDGVAVHGGTPAGTGAGAASIVIDAAGKVVVCGYSYNASGDWDMALWRYGGNGSLDPSFGMDGYVVHNAAAGGWRNDEGYDVTIEAGKILVSGRSNNATGSYDMVIWRYEADGTLDPGFGVDGIVVGSGAAGGTGNDYGYAIVVDARGRLLVSGTSTNASAQRNRDMVIWRYR
jgi:uncharacterized delta-60 repeat protein